ncbi:MAG: hypothetical protein JWR83_612 [Aeromicrobium sp.]|nr:hypothetical protein [Aeromicrobium sp.]
MSTENTHTSVFTDDSGSRKRAVAWTIRGASCLLAVGAVAVAVSVFGQVSLPGLDAPLHIPGVTQPKAATPDGRSTPGATAAAQAPDGKTGSATNTGVTSRAGSSTGSASTPSTASPTPTTPAATTKVTGKPTAKPTTAASPSHSPGSPPTEPPGKSKKTTTGE